MNRTNMSIPSAIVRRVLAAGLVLPWLVPAATAQAEQLFVQNHSFELPDFNPCGFGGPVPGWTQPGSAGAWNAGLGNQCAPLNGFPLGVPDGDQVGFVNFVNVPMKQVLAATLAAEIEYTLLVEVGRRSDGFPMVDYAIRLVAGGIVLAEDADTLEPTPGTFETSVITFTASAGHPALGAPIEIHLLNIAGPQSNFDNVRIFGGDGGPPGLPGDIEGDGNVDGADLGLLLGAWGPCVVCSNCPADMTGDCVVDGADLGVVLGAWTG